MTFGPMQAVYTSRAGVLFKADKQQVEQQTTGSRLASADHCLEWLVADVLSSLMQLI